MAGSVNSPTIEEARLRFPSFVNHPMFKIFGTSDDCTIGKGSAVEAGSVVTKPADKVASPLNPQLAGVPRRRANVLRYVSLYYLYERTEGLHTLQSRPP
ncbi:hypothetical protein MY10362_004828 [Beauveria mimosiformis]